MAECEKCEGFGQVLNHNHYWVPCPCQDEPRRRARVKAAGIPIRFRVAGLDDLKTVDAQRPAMDTARAYLAGFMPSNPTGLIFCGPTGTGKTTILAAMLCHLVRAGHKGVYWRANDLFDAARRYMNGQRVDEDRLGEDGDDPLHRARTIGLLALDDLMTERPTEWVREQMDLLINSRYDGCLPLLATTNFLREQWANLIGDRLASRLTEMCEYCKVKGPDLRATRQGTVPNRTAS